MSPIGSTRVRSSVHVLSYDLGDAHLHYTKQASNLALRRHQLKRDEHHCEHVHLVGVPVPKPCIVSFLSQA